MAAIVIGVLVGDLLGRTFGGEAAAFEGARIGFVVMGILAFFTPWRRTLLRLIRRWQQRRTLKELGLTENDMPPPQNNT